MKEALAVDNSNIDALQSLANLRMIRNNDEEARGYLTTVYQKTIAISEKLAETDLSEMDSLKNISMPSIDFRM